MRATGSYVTRKSRNAYTGLADGPLLVIAALKLPQAERDKMLQSIFVANPNGLKKMSKGHRKLAEDLQPKFARLETYYRSAGSGAWLGLKARLIGSAISKAIPENYSPTSFLINALLPPDSSNRTMDSHSSVTRWRSPHWSMPAWQARQLSVGAARAIARRGGVVGLWAVRSDVGDTIAAYADRLAEMADWLGEDHAAFGTDMNGIANPVIARFADLQGVIEHWRRRNISDRRIRKLAGENYARVLKQAFAARRA